MNLMEPNAMPRVTVCVPTYQSEGTLAQTLQSLLAQTYVPLEILVVDNASTDGTVEVVRRLSAGDPRVRIVVNETNLGAEGNFRRCVEVATGDLVAIFHADDLYDRHIVETQVRFLLDHPDAAAVFTDARLIDMNGRVFGERRAPAKLLRERQGGVYTFLPVFRSILRHHNFLMTPSAMVRRDLYRRLRLFESTLFGSSADLDVWLQILAQAPVGILAEPLMSYRISPQQGSVTLIRDRTDRADFFKVLDFYLDDPAVAGAMTLQDRRNYRWLDKADRVARALAQAERDPGSDLTPLLGNLYGPTEIIRALWQRPRGAVCGLLALALLSGPGREFPPSRRPIIRWLRRLAKI